MKYLVFVCILSVSMFQSLSAFAADEKTQPESEDINVYGKGNGVELTRSYVELYKKFVLPDNMELKKSELLKSALAHKLFAMEAVNEKMLSDEEVNFLTDGKYAELYRKKYYPADLGITDEILKSYYLSHIDDYTNPVRYHMVRLIFKDKAVADKVRSILLNSDNSTKLNNVVQNYSIDYLTWKTNGDMGSYPLKAFRPEVRDVIQKLKVGEYTEVLEHNGLYFIYKLKEILPGDAVPFDKVKEQISRVVLREKGFEAKYDLLDKLVKKYDFKWFPGVLTDERVGKDDE